MSKRKKLKWLTALAAIAAGLVAAFRPELLPVVDVLSEAVGVVPAL